ncbi:type II toxin-antitoxin system RelE family toxin [Corynebacterium oculi]|uniref:type II toxin-antitoxin system RelE family toxin n=1 Tax=Corynebacterium oculi TaxID=1544416 RepID=UPI0009E79F25|nr:type II toxin-antitoxin system RelE/ParE family toxin [Corynebacterium oculi]
MAWTIKYSDKAVKQLKRLDKPTAKNIVNYLSDVAELDDPRVRAKALTGPLSGLWRYRVGDYRVIAALESGHCVIVAVVLGHRSEIYDR